MKHGEGNEKFVNGDVYIGSYVNGKPEGYGEYLWVYFLIIKKRLTAVTSKAILKTVWDTAKVYGVEGRQTKTPITMKANTLTIKNVGMGFFSGQAEMFTKAIISMI